MSDQPAFVCLEGLSGTGKSTIAPMLAAVRGAVLVPTVPDFYQPLRRELDMRGNAAARMCFFLSALLTAIDDIRRHLATGTSVVVESYLARCLATHQAFGADLTVTLPAGLPQPVTYLLMCEADERRRRLAERSKPISKWDALAGEVADQISDAYEQFPMHRLDTTGLRPDEVVDAILTIETEGATQGADTEPLGGHAHVLPPVSGGTEAADFR
jgi:cytidylate kinase